MAMLIFSDAMTLGAITMATAEAIAAFSKVLVCISFSLGVFASRIGAQSQKDPREAQSTRAAFKQNLRKPANRLRPKLPGDVFADGSLRSGQTQWQQGLREN
jgi:hypothetical protein